MKLALFDLDHTLLPLDSDHAWGQFTTRIGWTDAATFTRRNDEFFAQYQAGALDIHDYVRFSTAAVRERGAQAAAAAHQQYMREVIEPHILPAALELVEQHRRAGDLLLIITATNEFVTRPIAHAFGIDELLAVELARGLGWGQVHTTFYSDSLNDLPLLEKADVPVATNPSAGLRALAQQRGWPILDLFDTAPA